MAENTENISTLFHSFECCRCVDCSTPVEIAEKLSNTLTDEPKSRKLNIISWNYDGKKSGLTTDKINLMRKLAPDILIIQECTYYECISFKKFYKHVKWYGDGKDSILGVGILSNEFEPNFINLNIYEQKFRYVIPYEININGINILLLAVWTKGILKCGDDTDDVHCLPYIENVFEAINFYDGLLRKYTEIIIIGDFNSFDKKQKRNERQIELEKRLENYDIFNCHFVIENKVTYYHNYKSNNPGINDYCF